MTNLKEIYEEWVNNPKFREAFKKNPEAALKEAGFDVSQADIKKIRAALSKLDNEKLDDRISK